MMKESPAKSPARSPRILRDRSRVSSRIQTPEPSQVQSSSYEAPAFFKKLLAFDRRISKWVHENCLTDFTYSFLRFFEFSGDGLFWLPTTAAFWLAPGAGSPDTRMFALNLFISLLFDLFVVGCIKSAVQRRRPTYNRGHLVVVSMDRWSFPSGHSTRALMIVTLIWLYTPMWREMVNHVWYPYLSRKSENNYFMSEFVLPYLENFLLAIANSMFVLWVLATTSSRVVLGRHYFLDVIGGIIIGVLETLVAHFCLHVPLKISELQHAYILSRFGMYEDVFWRFFHGRWFSTDYRFI